MSVVRLEPTQCVRPKKQQPELVTLISAHSPNARQASLHLSTSLASQPHRYHPKDPLNPKLLLVSASPMLKSVVPSADE